MGTDLPRRDETAMLVDNELRFLISCDNEYYHLNPEDKTTQNIELPIGRTDLQFL